MELTVTDNLMLDASGLTLTKDGYLVGDAKVSRAFNVQQYLGSELGLTDERKDQVFGVYRPEDLVFDTQSMQSLAGRPVTRGHPRDGVNSQNWKDLAKGQIGGVIRRDGEHVVAPMAIMDADAVKEVLAGARSLSAGYSVGITDEVGVAPDGTPYQFVMKGPLKYNHVGYLPDNNPRAGNTKLGDQRTTDELDNAHNPSGGRNMADNTFQVVFDGLTIDTTKQGKEAIEKLSSQLTDARNEANLAVKAKDEATAKHDAAIAAKDAEIDKLKASQLSDADLDKRVQARADLIATAKAIVDADYTGKTDAEIRKSVVTAKLGDAAVAGKSDTYLDARFDILAEDAKLTNADPVRAHLRAEDRSIPNNVTDARAAMIADLQNGHKPKTN